MTDLVSGLRVSAAVQQYHHGLHMAIPCSPEKGCVAILHRPNTHTSHANAQTSATVSISTEALDRPAPAPDTPLPGARSRPRHPSSMPTTPGTADGRIVTMNNAGGATCRWYSR